MRKCPNCDALIHEGSDYCPQCGFKHNYHSRFLLKFFLTAFSIIWSYFIIIGISQNYKTYTILDWSIILLVYLLPFSIYFHFTRKKHSGNKHIQVSNNLQKAHPIRSTAIPKKKQSVFFNLFKQKELNKIKELENEIANLRSLASPDVQRMYQLKDEISTLEQTLQEKEIEANTKIENFNLSIENLQNTTASLNTTLNNLNTEIANKKQLLIEMDEEILVQEFGLYTPYYDFASALDYKEELARIRSKQKDLIKNNKATHGNTQWTVNNNRKKGEKMVKDTQKLLLRAFNSECDTIVSKVKYTNFDASLDRIYKVAEAISKLGSLMEISVTDEYLNCKVKELRLAFEYQQKKQQEKEELREARAAQREAAKLQKEIEAERKKFEKEQTHYETALLKVLKALHNEPENQELIAKKEELEQHLVKVEQSLKDIDYREANQKAGYVYIISNIGAFGENVYKIGMTRRLDPQERIDELSGASVPFRFDVHAMIFSDDAPALEAALHRAFEDKKMNMVNNRKEFFKVTLDEIKEVIRQNFDKTVEFTDVADAEQYRISLKMKE